MKAYIIYIATLLAALALPATAQNGNPETKAAPDVPAMPYRLSTTVTGNAHGKVAIAATQPDGDKDTYVPLTADSLVYGATDGSDGNAGKNASKVKISVVPDKYYKLRDDYPKVYPTGQPDKGLTTKIDDDADGNPYCTFDMPASPVTVELAYAIPVESLIPICLKEDAADIDAALSLLPKYLSVILADGRKDSLKVADNKGWVLDKSSYDSKPGAVNGFYVYFSLPDSLHEAPFFREVTEGNFRTFTKVTNKTASLKPDDVGDKEVVISGGTDNNLNGNTEGTGDGQAFNGTIEDANVKSLEIGSDVKDATLTLKDVTVTGGDSPTDAKTDVKSGADLTIQVEGTSSLGTLTIESGAAVVLTKSEDATLKDTQVANNGTFRDSTASLTTVTGTGALTINSNLQGGGSSELNTPVILSATVSDQNGTTTFIWQQANADGSYTEVRRQAYTAPAPASLRNSATTSITDTYEPNVSTVGSTSYRCLIEREVTLFTGNAITLLSTKQATVTVTSTPEPEPVYYTVTVPKLTGATVNPSSAVYTVGEGENFSFTLTLDKDYDQSKPVVTTDRDETLTPVDGTYTILNINEDVSLTVTGIVKNSTVSNADVEANDLRVWSDGNLLHIYTPQAREIALYTFGGQLLSTRRIPAGNTSIPMPDAPCILKTADKSYKLSR